MYKTMINEFLRHILPRLSFHPHLSADVKMAFLLEHLLVYTVAFRLFRYLWAAQSMSSCEGEVKGARW
jgi:hypothetical protein